MYIVGEKLLKSCSRNPSVATVVFVSSNLPIFHYQTALNFKANTCDGFILNFPSHITDTVHHDGHKHSIRGHTAVTPVFPTLAASFFPHLKTSTVYVAIPCIAFLKIQICKCTSLGSPRWRRRLVWLDNHAPAGDKEKVFCEKKTWAAVLHPG